MNFTMFAMMLRENEYFFKLSKIFNIYVGKINSELYQNFYFLYKSTNFKKHAKNLKKGIDKFLTQ